MAQEHVFDLLSGYALGSLDEVELLQVARHLPHCAICRSELATYWDAADQIALSTPLRTPPPDLREKILRRVEQPAAAHAASRPDHTPAARAVDRPAAPSSPPSGVPRQRGLLDALRDLFGRPAGFALGALALLLILFMGVSNLALWREVNSLRARVPEDNVHIVQLQGEPNAPEAHGYLMVFKEENYGTLVVEDAPALEPGKQYQLWLIQDGKRTSGGVFSVGEEGYGVLEVSSSQPLDSFSSFGITVEPEGGSPGPTGKKILGGGL